LTLKTNLPIPGLKTSVTAVAGVFAFKAFAKTLKKIVKLNTISLALAYMKYLLALQEI
jgi:hypothetical protein